MLKRGESVLIFKKNYELKAQYLTLSILNLFGGDSGNKTDSTTCINSKVLSDKCGLQDKQGSPSLPALLASTLRYPIGCQQKQDAGLDKPLLSSAQPKRATFFHFSHWKKKHIDRACQQDPQHHGKAVYWPIGGRNRLLMFPCTNCPPKHNNLTSIM